VLSEKPEFKLFVRAMRAVELIFDMDVDDYEEAYEMADEFFTKRSKEFIEEINKMQSETFGFYEKDLMRYFFIKSIEQVVSDELFQNTSRGNKSEVSYSPSAIHLKSYPTNLPKHLEEVVDSYQGNAKDFAKVIYTEIITMDGDPISYTILNAVQLWGFEFGQTIASRNLKYMTYPTSDLLTPKEIKEIAGKYFCEWLKPKGFYVKETDYSSGCYKNVIADRMGKVAYIFMEVCVEPDVPGFIPGDLDIFSDLADKENALPFVGSMSIGSMDPEHLRDGIVLAGDKVRFKMHSFEKLELKSVYDLLAKI